MDNYKSSQGNNVQQIKGCQNNTIHHTIQLLLDFLVEILQHGLSTWTQNETKLWHKVNNIQMLE